MEDKALIKNWWKYGPLVGGVGISILAIYSGEKLYFILSAYLIGMFVYNIFKKMKSNP